MTLAFGAAVMVVRWSFAGQQCQQFCDMSLLQGRKTSLMQGLKVHRGRLQMEATQARKMSWPRRLAAIWTRWMSGSASAQVSPQGLPAQLPKPSSDVMETLPVPAEAPEDNLQPPLPASKPTPVTSWRPTQQREFWRWSAGIGWTLDLFLLGWALFLRGAGFFGTARDEKIAEAKIEASKSGYDDLVEQQIQTDVLETSTNKVLDNVLSDVTANLQQLRTKASTLRQAMIEPNTPSSDAVALSELIDELQQEVEVDRAMVRDSDDALMQEIQETRMPILRTLFTRIQESRTKTTMEVPPTPDYSLNTKEMVDFVEGSLLPVVLFVGMSAMVTVLSQQFVRVIGEWKRRQWKEAQKQRKIQLRRFEKFRSSTGKVVDSLVVGHYHKAHQQLQELLGLFSRWAAEPTWEELVRAEAAAFWERWGPQAFRLEAVLPGAKEAQTATQQDQAQWVAQKWFLSAQAVIKDYVSSALESWAEANRQKTEVTGLVIRIFGRWSQSPEWVNIANLPLAGDWREKALRLLLPSSKDLEDVPLLGPLSETLLTNVVASQVSRVVQTSVWGSLTTDLWLSCRRGPDFVTGLNTFEFEIGYEVVEVESREPETMCALARAMPKSGTPGRVVRVPAQTEKRLREMET